MKVGRPPMFKTPEEMQIAIDKYFEECDNQPTVSGLAISLGFTNRGSILDYGLKDEFTSTIKKAKIRIEQRLEQLMTYSKEHPTAGLIFNLKNNYGYSDKTEVRTIDLQDVSVPQRETREDWESKNKD